MSALDLVRLLEVRASVNLTIRAANERPLIRWADDYAVEERRAAREDRAPVLPPPPDQRAERAGERTIESFARTVKAMFVAAHRHGKITYLLWTAAPVDGTRMGGRVARWVDRAARWATDPC